jgi:Flp pilus assembly protein TadG
MTRRFAFLCFLLATPLGAQTQTPTEVYTAYRAAFEHATDFTPLRPFLAASVLAQVDATPTATRPQLFTAVKATSQVRRITGITETTLVTGDHVLTVQGVDARDQPLLGVVELRREADSWKIVRETWRHPQ